jgi:hypothetical protein
MASSRRIERAGPAVADIYLDSCCFIYLVEGEPEWRAVVEQRLRDLEPTSRLVTSQLARLECRTKPTRDGNRALLERYDMLFGADRVAVLDVLNPQPPSSGRGMRLCRAALTLRSGYFCPPRPDRDALNRHRRFRARLWPPCLTRPTCPRELQLR